MSTLDNFIMEIESAFNIRVNRSETVYTPQGWNPMAVELSNDQLRKFLIAFKKCGSHAGGSYTVTNNNTIFFSEMFGKDIAFLLSVCR